MVEFPDATIQVKFPGGAAVTLPSAFVWQGREHRVLEVQASWEVHDGPGPGTTGARGRRRWWQRRHRTYYRVRAEDGRVYEIYRDRAARGQPWILGRVYSNPPT